MAKGAPLSPPGGGGVRPGAERRGWAPALSAPAIVAVAVAVLAGIAGTVLLARDAGGPPTSGNPGAGARATATPAPRAGPNAPAAPPAPSPSSSPFPVAFTPSSATLRPAAPTPVPPIFGSPPPLPSYAGPTPETLLSGPTPAPSPSASRVTPDQLNLGFTPSGKRSKPQQVVVVNDGGQPLHVFPTGIDGDNAGDFRIVSDACSGATVQPAQECVVSIVYSPRTVGNSHAGLLVSDDSGGSPDGRPTKTSSVPLTGASA